jgi:hypothetical protein
MQKNKEFAYISGFVIVWGIINRLFSHAATSMEARLFHSGHAADWWVIVLLYWVADTAIVIGFARLMRQPFGFQMPPKFPFFLLASDLAVEMLLLHLTLLCFDTNFYPYIALTGLKFLPQLLFSLMILWFITGLIRYRKIALLFGSITNIRPQ